MSSLGEPTRLRPVALSCCDQIVAWLAEPPSFCFQMR